jgi:flagellar biosynthetic protein FliP
MRPSGRTIRRWVRSRRDAAESSPRETRADRLRTSARRSFALALLVMSGLGVARVLPAAAASARPVPRQVTLPTLPTTPTSGDGSGGDSTISINLPGKDGKHPDSSVTVILMLTVLAVAPSILILMTGFTRIIVVLSLTRNALGVQAIPPNQVLAGLALVLGLFVMFPTLSRVNEEALKPLQRGEITQEQAYKRAVDPVKSFMLKQTRKSELQMFIHESGRKPAKPADVGMSTLIPAFILSELKTAFIIGFIVFVPFLVIDLIVSSALMSMGMFMLPPVLVSLPFKLLLFVMVDGWALIVRSLITSFHH